MIDARARIIDVEAAGVHGDLAGGIERDVARDPSDAARGLRN